MRTRWIRGEGWVAGPSPRGPGIWLTAIVPSPQESGKAKGKLRRDHPKRLRHPRDLCAAFSWVPIRAAIGRL